ncbi:TolB family protein [Chiayiivirga flava]|uniref:Tol biopolymer transport system component n=1 Tax=Chiayiivirga flava TaxID=659595 RepID=A0A7W8D6Q7_9GAMM|nr:PD40 domain-containing protein [Chiayiivirga flava]MBB5208961.1 Tol biopolymer transport system component [Chiayiivirga flava]
MPVSVRPPIVLACALAAGLCVAAPARAEWIYARLQPAEQTTFASGDVSVSNDGKTVVFVSGATQWVDGTPPAAEVYAYDLDSAFVEVISITSTDTFTSGVSPSVSRDGRYVAFLALGGPYDGGTLSGWQVLRKDRVTGALELVTATGAGAPLGPNVNQDDVTAISGDGRYVAFVSRSPDLGVSTDQVFLKDMQTGTVEHVSVDASGAAPGAAGDAVMYSHAVSDDGRYVAFISPGPLLPGVTATGQVYVRDTVANTTELVSRRDGANGQPGTTGANRPALSPSGRFVVFQAYGGLGSFPNASGAFLRDRVTHATVSIPSPSALPAGSSCFGGDVSDAGTVLIQCGSTGQVFLWVPGSDPLLVSTDAGGNPANASSGNSLGIDASGLSMVFESIASNIDPADTNNSADVFLLVESSVIDGIFRDGFED